MTNPYFNFTLPAVPGALIDAVIYNEEMTNISEAFDVIPPSTQLVDGTLIYSGDSGSCVNKATSLAFSPVGPYIFGEQVALRVNIPNNSLTTVSINHRGERPIWFDQAGGAVAQDMQRGGFYTLVFDGSRFASLEMSRRGIVGSSMFAASAEAAFNRVKNMIYGGSVVGSIEFFGVGETPADYYPFTTWDIMTESVDSLTDGVVSSTDLVAWIRRL